MEENSIKKLSVGEAFVSIHLDECKEQDEASQPNPLLENYNSWVNSIVESYRKYAGLGEYDIIDENNIDNYALARTACDHVCTRSKVKETLLSK